MAQTNGISAKVLFAQSACFGVSYFAFQLSRAVVEERSVQLIDGGSLGLFFALFYVALALGVLSFAASRRLFPSDFGRDFTALTIGVAFIDSSLAIVALEDAAQFTLATFVLMFAVGYITASVSYVFAMALSQSGKVGTALGAGMSAAIVVQYFAQHVFYATHAAYLVSTVFVVMVLGVVLLRRSWHWVVDDPSPDFSGMSSDHRYLLVIAVLAMSIIYCSVQGVFSSSVVGGVVVLSNETTIVYAAAVLSAGLIFDARSGRYALVATASAVLIAVCMATYLSVAPYDNMAACILAACGGFYSMFLVAPFIMLAPRTTSPELWAGAGRAVSALATAPLLVVAPWTYTVFGSVAVITLGCVAAVISLMVLLPAMDARDNSAKVDDPLSREEAAARFAQDYGFTPRETAVFLPLVNTELGVQDIADTLYISRRVAQRHIASIYEKAHVSSRIGLFQALEEYRTSNH